MQKFAEMKNIPYFLPVVYIEYTGLRKAVLDSAYASSNITFLHSARSILDGKSSNII